MKQKSSKKKLNTMIFSKWSRKSYAVFRSQGKQIIITTMVMAASLTFEANKATAQVITTDSTQVYELDEVVVSGEQDSVAFSKIARIVTILNKKEIEQAPVSDLNELLEYALSLDVRQRGQEGVQADIAMRGGTFDQTLILLNGINLTDPQTGHHNLNLPLSLSAIEKIEVLEGPAARAYGVNAFNGAINIITNASSHNQFKALLKAGEYGFTKQDIAIHKRVGNTYHLVAAGHKQSDGYLPNNKTNNTDFNSTNLFYHGKWLSLTQQINLQAGINRKKFGANSFYTPAFPEQFEATETYFGCLTYQIGKKRLNINPSIYFRRHNDRFELFRDTVPDWYHTHNYHSTDIAGGRIPISFQTKFGTFRLSGGLRYAHIYSNVLGKNMTVRKKVPKENAWFTKQDERFHTSILANYILNIQRFYFTTGVLVSHYNILKRTRVYPGVETSYELIKNFRIFGSYNEAMRLPTFTDLYYSGPTNIGNPDLKPEESATIEGGVKYIHRAFRVQGACFYRKGKNIIEWVKEKDAADDALWQTTNIDNLTTFGVDVSSSVNIESVLRKTPIKRINVSYAYVETQELANDFETKYIADYLKHKLSARVSHTVYKNFYAEWGVHFQDRNGTYTKYKDGAYGNKVPYAPFWLINLKSGWKRNHWNLFASVSNLFNQTYYDLANVPQPGRWMQLGVQYNFCSE